MHYVYVLKDPKQFYIGSTNDLKRRFKEHVAGMSLATKGRGPWKLVYYEASLSHKGILSRKRYLKTALGKRYLKKRINDSE
jgi:putative endonuclease